MDMYSNMEYLDGNYYFESSAPRFFRKLHDESAKLDIPRKFVIQHGMELLSSGEVTYLKVPCGTVWKMGLEMDESNNMWFQDGWLEFVNFYDIERGYLLVFTYRGGTKFDVVIFDRSYCEIRYLVKPCRDKEKDTFNHGLFSPKTEEMDVEILEDVNLWTNAASSSKHRSCQAGVGNFQSSRNGKYAESGNFEKENTRACTPELTEIDNSDPSFSVVMLPIYLCNNYSLDVPARFMMKYLGSKDCFVKLITQAGRYWTVQCNFNLTEDAMEAKIRRGWKEFVKDNKLVVGDTCVFELIRGAEVYFQVSILRAMNSGPSYATRSGSTYFSRHKTNSHTNEYEAKRIKRHSVSNFCSEYPFFKVIMTEKYLKRSTVSVESNFAKRYFKKKEQILKLKVDDELWDVKAFFRKRTSVLSAGWLDFMRDNFLQAGDICIFELIELEDMVLNVSILRDNQ